VLAHGLRNPVGHGTHCMQPVEWVGRWKLLKGWTKVWSCERHAPAPSCRGLCGLPPTDLCFGPCPEATSKRGLQQENKDGNLLLIPTYRPRSFSTRRLIPLVVR
jgi:hypothetical protein